MQFVEEARSNLIKLFSLIEKDHNGNVIAEEELRNFLSSDFEEFKYRFPSERLLRNVLPITYENVKYNSRLSLTKEEWSNWVLSNSKLRTVGVQGDYFHEDIYTSGTLAVEDFKKMRILDVWYRDHEHTFFVINSNEADVEKFRSALNTFELKWKIDKMQNKFVLMPKSYVSEIRLVINYLLQNKLIGRYDDFPDIDEASTQSSIGNMTEGISKRLKRN